MAQDTFASWSVTASNNTSVTGDGAALDIAEGWPAANINNAIRAIMSACTLAYGAMPSGTSRPSYLTSGKFWINTTTATAPILTYYDGTDDIAVMTFDHTANTIALSAVVSATMDINGLTAETAPAATDTFPFYDASAAANRKIVPEDLLKIIDVITAETAPAVADEVAIYDASATDARKMTLANLLKVVDALTAETAPATGDELLLYDASAATADKITLADMLLVINNLTADATPDTAADYVVTYDADAGAAKKVLLSNLTSTSTLTVGTAKTLSTGTTSEFTSLPAGIESIEIALHLVSTTGTSGLRLEVGYGAGSWMTSGYVSGASNDANQSNDTTAFAIVQATAATNTASGVLRLTKVNDTGDIWALGGEIYTATGSALYFCAGSVIMTGELDAVRLTTVGGTDTFDAGQWNIKYWTA